MVTSSGTSGCEHRVVANCNEQCLLNATSSCEHRVVVNCNDHYLLNRTSGCEDHSWQGFLKLVCLLMSRPGEKKASTISFNIQGPTKILYFYIFESDH